MFNRERKSIGVSEILGTMLLLMVAISAVSIVYFHVLSDDGPAPTTIVKIVGKGEGEYIYLEHMGGEDLDLDNRITYTIGGETSYPTTIGALIEQDKKPFGVWNLGERLVIPIRYNLDRLDDQTAVITGLDSLSNSIVFHGPISLPQPISDVSVNLEVIHTPPIKGGDEVIVIITITSSGGNVEGAGDVTVQYNIPEGLDYVSSVSPTGHNDDYDPETGYWQAGNVKNNHSAKIVITLTVNETFARRPTQLALILDGSGSISSSDWIMMKTGLANAVENSSILPHDGSVELTIVQFGAVDPPKAQVEIGPIIIDESNKDSIRDDILVIDQMVTSQGGATPMSCGIRLAADQLFNIGDFDNDKRQSINLVTDGIPNCDWIPGTYTGTWLGNGWYKDSSQKNSGSYSAASNSVKWGEMISKDLNTEDATSITIDFQYRLTNTESGDLKLYYYDGDSYNLISSLGGGTENTWRHYTQTINNPSYFKSNFHIRFDTYLTSGEFVWIDDVLISTDSVVLLNDGFEENFWNNNWWNFGKARSEEAKEYVINLLNMTEDVDEFNALAVGPDPEIYWLNGSIIWPDPYIWDITVNNTFFGPGWVTHIDSFEQFGFAMKEMFKAIFSISNTVNFVSSTTYDPNPGNHRATVTIG